MVSEPQAPWPSREVIAREIRRAMLDNPTDDSFSKRAEKREAIANDVADVILARFAASYPPVPGLQPGLPMQEAVELADKIDSWTPSSRPITLIARERRLAVQALRALAVPPPKCSEEPEVLNLQQPTRHDLIIVREALKAMLGLFDDEGNMIATFEELQTAVNDGYDILGKTRLSYEVQRSSEETVDTPGAVTVTILAQGDSENTPAEAVHHALEYARKAGFIEAWSDPL